MSEKQRAVLQVKTETGEYETVGEIKSINGLCMMCKGTGTIEVPAGAFAFDAHLKVTMKQACKCQKRSKAVTAEMAVREVQNIILRLSVVRPTQEIRGEVLARLNAILPTLREIAKDTARLDKLEASGPCTINEHDTSAGESAWIVRQEYYATVREAIDGMGK